MVKGNVFQLGLKQEWLREQIFRKLSQGADRVSFSSYQIWGGRAEFSPVRILREDVGLWCVQREVVGACSACPVSLPG